MAQKTEKETRKDINLDPPRREKTDMPKHDVKNGLVLFPKYMLINNCHLKMTDLQRFQREQQAEQRRALLQQQGLESPGLPTEASRETLASTASPTDLELMSQSTRGPFKFEASWGAPELRKGGPQWAGNGMPSGASHKTSNPFR